MKRGIMIFSILFLALLLPFASAGFLDKLFGKDVRESPQNFSVTVGNSAPTLDVQTIINPNIQPASTGSVNISFIATDNNGASTLNDSTLLISLNYPGGGEQTRTGTNANCVSNNINSTTKRYNCSVNMFYYDHVGSWTINVTLRDAGGLQGKDDDNTTLVPSLKSIAFSLGTIGLGSVAPGQTNITSLTNTTLTNNGNYDLNGGTQNLSINSTPLLGVSNQTYSIPANNFRASGSSVPNVCLSGTTLIGTPIETAIPSVILSKGSPATPLPTENISYCLTLVPTGLIDQVYSTTASGGIAWDLRV
jgi:hypothetical protein